MLLVIDNETKHLKLICSFLKRNKFDYKIKNFRKVGLNMNADAIILTGGPEHPLAPIFSREIDIIKKFKKPIFGICLGFQLICRAYSSLIGKMRREDVIRNVRIKKRGDIFRNCGKLPKVSEHHNWRVEKIGKDLEVLAVSKYGIEAIKHKRKPIYGVQFHAEIKWKNDGHKCFENFLDIIKANIR